MNRHTGSDFDDFLREEGILEEVTAMAHERLRALKLQDEKVRSGPPSTSLADEYEVFAAEDRELAEAGMEDYARALLAAEDDCDRLTRGSNGGWRRFRPTVV